MTNEFTAFTSDTTLHGIKYPFVEKYGVIRRCIWFLLILTMGVFLVWMLVIATLQYYEYKSTTSSTPHVSNLPMPSITVCPNYAMNNKSIFTNYPEQANDIIQYVIPSMFGTINITHIPDSVVEFLKIETLSQFFLNAASNQSFIYCRVQLVIVDCRPLLKNVITDQGVCSTFHSQEYIDKNGPIMVETAGPNNGISFFLDTEPDDELFPLSYGTGFRVLIHDPKVYPLMEERSFVVGPGTETFVALQKSVSKYLRVPYSEKDCVNDENIHLYQGYSLDKYYSSEGCGVNCTYGIIYNDCNCSFFSAGNDSCTLYDFIACAYYKYVSTSQSYIINTCSYCMSTCEATNFNIQVTQMGFPNKLAIQNAKLLNLSVQTKEAMSSRYMEVKVFYENLRYTINEQIPITDAGDLFSTFGGFMGLFMGASIITVVEFIDFFIIFLVKKIFHREIKNNNNKVSTLTAKEKEENDYEHYINDGGLYYKYGGKKVPVGHGIPT